MFCLGSRAGRGDGELHFGYRLVGISPDIVHLHGESNRAMCTRDQPV